MKFTKIEWTILAAIFCVLVFSGCSWFRGSVQPGSPPLPGGPAGALAGLAVWATWAAGVSLLACGVAAIFLPNKLEVAKVAVGCLAALAVAGILHWISAHWAVLLGLCAGVLVLAGIAYLYLHRRALECYVGQDLDGDKKVG